MASTPQEWETQVEDFRGKYEFLLEAREKMKQSGQAAHIVVKPQGQQCTYNYECESQCCLRFKKRGKGRGRGRKNDDDDDDDEDDKDGPSADRLLRRLLQAEDGTAELIVNQQDERFGGKVCVQETRCDDDISDTLYTVWNFFAGLLIGSLCICIFLQYRFFRMQKNSAMMSAQRTDGVQMPQVYTASPGP